MTLGELAIAVNIALLNFGIAAAADRIVKAIKEDKDGHR